VTDQRREEDAAVTSATGPESRTSCGKLVITRYWAQTSNWYRAINSRIPAGTMVQITSRLWFPCVNHPLPLSFSAPRHKTYPSAICVPMNVAVVMYRIM
jgi:hypothetical protein